MSNIELIDGYLAELCSALITRGSDRRRFLHECRDHLVDTADECGEEQAVRAFGPATDVAAEFDAEVAARRGVRSTAATAVAVLATGASTLALIHGASANASAPTAWAVTFFVAAQLAGISAGLASVQAIAIRRATTTPADVALLARRNTHALVAAGVTIFSAGAALPGNGSAAVLLAGPIAVCVAMTAVMRTRSITRRLEGSGVSAARSPLDDLGQIAGLPIASVSAPSLLALSTCLAAVAAFVWDRGEHGTVGEALLTAGIEGTAVIACFLVFGTRLGLRRR